MVRVLLMIALLAAVPVLSMAEAPPATQPTTAPVTDRAAIEGEIKLDTDAIKSITDELAGHEKDAADAEALAKTPPATVAETDKQAYIDKRKNEEQAAQDAAAEARERLKEAQTSLDQARAQLKAMDSKP